MWKVCKYLKPREAGPWLILLSFSSSLENHMLVSTSTVIPTPITPSPTTDHLNTLTGTFCQAGTQINVLSRVHNNSQIGFTFNLNVSSPLGSFLRSCLILNSPFLETRYYRQVCTMHPDSSVYRCLKGNP